METDSLAGTMLTLAGRGPSISASMRASSPTRMTSVSALRAAQSTAPATTSSGRVVAAHRVDRDADATLRAARHVPRRTSMSNWPSPRTTERQSASDALRTRCRASALGLDAHGLAAVVPAAVGARVMRALLLMAVRTLLELRRRQRVVRSALALAGVRDAPLGNSHGPPVWSPDGLSSARPVVAPLGQAGQARVDRVFVVGMIGDRVQVHAAGGAQPAAIVATQKSNRFGQRDRFAHGFGQVQLVVIVDLQRVRLRRRGRSACPCRCRSTAAPPPRCRRRPARRPAFRQRLQCPRSAVVRWRAREDAAARAREPHLAVDRARRAPGRRRSSMRGRRRRGSGGRCRAPSRSSAATL